jgi:Zn-dependent protease
MIFGYSWQMILVRIIAVILAMSVHEVAHGLVSYWMGDPSAKRAGRLSLNPFVHIDWAGLGCLLLFGVGWARPVPINPRYYKHKKTGIIWTSFAGPAANFILSFLCILIYCLLFRFAYSFLFGTFGYWLGVVLQVTATLSLGFGVFNLLPIPPLDGSKIFWSFLPDDLYYKYMNPSPWISMIFLVVLFSGVLNTPISKLISTLLGWIFNACIYLCGL